MEATFESAADSQSACSEQEEILGRPIGNRPQVNNLPHSLTTSDLVHHIRMASDPNVRIELLGGFQIIRDGQHLTGVSSRLRALLTYLVLHPGSSISRQQIAFQFWPDSEESQARTNLRQLLHHLRALLPEADLYLQTDHQMLLWRPTPTFSIDVSEFETAAVQGNLDSAAALYRGDLLPGLYDEWLEPERERLQRLYESVLDRLVTAAEQRGDFLAAIRAAELRLQRDTLREASYQTLMRLHAAHGDRTEAMRVYQRCADVLRKELDVEPSPATRSLRDRLLETQPNPEPRRPAAPSISRSAREIPLFGRESELARLQQTWSRAAQGHPSIVVLTGDPGIGKTRLLEELIDRAAASGACMAHASCYAADRALPYTAVADWLRSPAMQRGILELTAVQRSQLARVLPELLMDQPEIAPQPPISEAWNKRHFFEALARAVLRSPTPVLLTIDDLQWCDLESVEWLHYLLRFDASAKLMIAATARTDETASDRLQFRHLGIEIALGPLDESATLRLAAQIGGKGLATEALYRQTHGNPLFVVETARAGWSDNAEIPAKVHAVITARLGRLTEDAQQLAGVAAIIGRPFSIALATAVASLPEDRAADAIDELWKHRVLQQESEGYDFSHGSLRDVAYASVGPARRQLLHRRVAESLESGAPETDAVCTQIAGHFERAALPLRAIPFYERAAHVLRRRFAEQEAIEVVSKALQLLETVPPSPERDRLELPLLLALGISLSVTEGYASERAGKVYARARLLCELVGDTVPYFGVLAGSWSFHVVRGELKIAREMTERYLALARPNTDPVLLAAGHFCLGVVSSHLALIREARKHLDLSLQYESASQRAYLFLDFGPELGVFCRSYVTHLIWLMGDADEALTRSRESVARAESISHPFSLGLALAYSAMLHHFRDEPEQTEEQAAAAAALCRRYGFRYYLAWTPILVGWARTRLGAQQSGLREMVEGYNELRATGAGLRAPYYLTLIAEACGRCGDFNAGVRYLEEATNIGAETGEAWLQPELQRVRGDLLLRTGERTQAETCYRSAIRTARQIGARAWEQRAVASLAGMSLAKVQGQPG